MNHVFQGFTPKVIVGLLAMASMLLTVAGCNDGGGSTGPTQEDRDSVTAVKEGLSLDFDAGESADGLTGGEDGKITLPSTGQDGVSIAWTSDKPDIIANDGSITQPKGGNQKVSLTATISKNGAEETKVFVLTVLGDAPIAEILPRSSVMVGSLQPDNYWANIFPFSIKVSNASFAGEYRLAVRLASADEPDAAGIRSAVAAITRNLSTNPINVLMSFHMDTDLFDAATDWGKTWGDGSALLDTAKAARLQPETTYKLYTVRPTGDDTVHSLSSFTTDAELTPADLDTLGMTDLAFFNFPLDFTDYTGALGHAFTIRQNEPFLFLFGAVNPSTSLTTIINSITISDCNYTMNDCLPIVSGNYNIFFQSLIAASDKRIMPSIVGSRGFSDSLISNGRLPYTVAFTSTTYSFNMVIE